MYITKYALLYKFKNVFFGYNILFLHFPEKMRKYLTDAFGW